MGGFAPLVVVAGVMAGSLARHLADATMKAVDAAIEFFRARYAKNNLEFDESIMHGRKLADEVLLFRDQKLQMDAREFCAGGCRVEPPPDRFCIHVLARRELESRLKK